MIEHYIKAAGVIVLSSFMWAAETVIDTVSHVPTNWIDDYGLPVAFLIATLVAVVWLFRALDAERRGRIADRDGVIAQLRKDAEEAAKARSELICATNKSAVASEKMAHEFSLFLDWAKGRPCMWGLEHGLNPYHSKPEDLKEEEKKP